MRTGAYIVGGVEFSRACQEALLELPSALAANMRDAGERVRRRATALAPVGTSDTDRHPGALRRAARLSTRKKPGHVSVEISFDVGPAADYSGVIEFAHRGRWASLSQRLGPPPRYGYKAVEQSQAEIERLVAEAMVPALRLGGFV